MDIYAAIQEGRYKAKLPYPGSKPKKPHIPAGYEEAQAVIEREWTVKINAYTVAKQLYQDEQSDIATRFREDVIDYVGLTGHPKATRAFYLAWDRGHSSGYPDVVMALEELAELLL